MTREEADQMAIAWIFDVASDDIQGEASDVASLSVMLLGVAADARRVALEDARVVAISEIGRMPVGERSQALADRVGGRIRSLATPTLASKEER